MRLVLNNLDCGLEPESTSKNRLTANFTSPEKSLLVIANQMLFHIKAYFCGLITIIFGFYDLHHPKRAF